jgi:hypothetical protein
MMASWLFDKQVSCSSGKFYAVVGVPNGSCANAAPTTNRCSTLNAIAKTPQQRRLRGWIDYTPGHKNSDPSKIFRNSWKFICPGKFTTFRKNWDVFHGKEHTPACAAFLIHNGLMFAI